MVVVVIQLWIITLFMILSNAKSRQLDIIMGLDASKNTDERGFDFQREFFRKLTKDIYEHNDTSVRVGVFAYDDTIQLCTQTKIWPNQNSTTKVQVINNIDSLNYTSGNDNPYLDHALRFVLAIFDDDRAENEERECSEKVLMMVVTDQIKKWSDGSKDLIRLKEMGVKLFFVVVGDKARNIKLIKAEENEFVNTFDELNSSDNLNNSSEFLKRTLSEGIGSCCSSTFPRGQLKYPTCSTHMGNKCKVLCDRFLNSQFVILGTCQTNGVWSHGGTEVCKEFEVHVVSLAIGVLSALVAFVIVTVLLVFLCKRKWENTKKAAIPPAVESPTQRSVRNQYSASTAKSSTKDTESVSSDGVGNDDEEEAQVYDYAQEESLMALSKRPMMKKSKGTKVSQDIQFLKTNETAKQNHHQNTSYTGEVYQNTEVGNCRLLSMSTKSNPPQPCIGPSGTAYVEYDAEDIHYNDGSGLEEDQEVYVNTVF